MVGIEEGIEVVVVNHNKELFNTMHSTAELTAGDNDVVDSDNNMDKDSSARQNSNRMMDGSGRLEVTRNCCICYDFAGVNMAKGFNWLGTARGPIIMSNIFLSTALIWLASEQVGCLVEEDEESEELVVMQDCQERVYGAFSPAALITNIAVFSGILSALFMPVAGALIDFTNHRWKVGIISASLMTLIQIIQIGTNSQTWFAMSVLQAVTGFFYQVQILASYAYLPDMARKVTRQTMTNFSAAFSMVQFGSQAVFLVVILAASFAFGMDDVQTARLSQAVNSLGIILSFGMGWAYLPKIKARHQLEEGKSIIWQGFVQNWNTFQRINRDYKRSIKWFLLGVLFGEPAANAFTVVAVVFLSEQLGMSSGEIGILFFVVLVSMIPGGYIGQLVANRTNANTALRFSMFCLFLLSVFAGVGLTKDNVYPVTYIWGVLVGLMLGSYYPSLGLFMSLVTPKGQEAELSGFFVYCTQILVWLPPLVFSFLVESNVDQGIGIICVGFFFLIAVALLSMAAPFDELLAEVRTRHDDLGSSKRSQMSASRKSHHQDTEEEEELKQDEECAPETDSIDDDDDDDDSEPKCRTSSLVIGTAPLGMACYLH